MKRASGRGRAPPVGLSFVRYTYVNITLYNVQNYLTRFRKIHFFNLRNRISQNSNCIPTYNLITKNIPINNTPTQYGDECAGFEIFKCCETVPAARILPDIFI